ncbi:adenylosuccinate lyase [Maribacter polysaccharolyticus]|uniref:adenylosuccinate lyase n=1 Tax=Maribacter polysaccharolyticus TaxID=3020831 RepID=UPI00237FCBCE|nr:adenylosuccinate lyase [Maribacter polysaccharolyticus]MDE3740720.1 adenylosuccinate lyase [Maribacter polysaccharolyticus]
MIKEQLIESLDYVDATRKKRTEMSLWVLNKPELLPPLLEIAFEGRDPIANKACWILEYVAKRNIDSILPLIDDFTENLHTLALDSSVRPMAKICELLITAFFNKKRNETKQVLTPKHLELIASTCFDWLIGEYKVATKAYSMTSLWHIGKAFEWIHPELKMVLEQNYTSGSPAYRARARTILAKLNALK